MIRHAIVDRNLPAAVDAEYLQVRDKELSGAELFDLVGRALRLGPRVVVNDRVDIALAAGAHGVHLRSTPIPPRAWRRIVPAGFVIGVSCHGLADIAAAEGADYVYFSPVFESPGKGPAVGLEALREAVRVAPMPVIALGGVTWENAGECLKAGAAGVAGIRLFRRP